MSDQCEPEKNYLYREEDLYFLQVSSFFQTPLPYVVRVNILIKKKKQLFR